MRIGYIYLYKYLILYIVLSFIDNKHIINCEKVKMNKNKMEDLSDDFENGGVSGNNATDNVAIRIFNNFSALPQKSDFETGDGERKFLESLLFLFCSIRLTFSKLRATEI